MKSQDKQIDVRIKSIKEIEKKIEIKDLPQGDLSLELRLGVHTERKEENDLVIALKLLCLYQNNPIISYAVAYTFTFEHIEEVFNFSDVIEDKVGVLSTMVGMTIGGLRGMLAIRLQETPYSHIILPYINPQMLIDNIKKGEPME